jgi:hypothetical protein
MKNPVSGTFRSLRSFNFRLWTAGGLISNVGTWMQRDRMACLVVSPAGMGRFHGAGGQLLCKVPASHNPLAIFGDYALSMLGAGK